MGLFDFFVKEDPKKLLESLDKAQKLLDDRYEKKQMSSEVYQKQCIEFGKRREAIIKKYKIDEY